MKRGSVTRCAAILLAASLPAGCSLFQNEEGPRLASGQNPVLTADQLNSLRLAHVPQVFSPSDRITIEHLDLPAQPNDSFLGGQYVFSNAASITVRLYGEERDVLASLNVHLRGPLSAYQLGTAAPGMDFPLTWWYHEGPPGSIVYTYGNALVVIRRSTLEPDDIPTAGVAAAREVALRILRVSMGKPAVPGE